jgi:hypothetical protein
VLPIFVTEKALFKIIKVTYQFVNVTTEENKKEKRLNKYENDPSATSPFMQLIVMTKGAHA